MEEDSSDGESSAYAVCTNEFSEFLLEDDRVQEIVADLLSSLKPKEHYTNILLSHKNCYSGKDLITWLSNHLACTREEAVSTFDHIQRKVNLMKHVKSLKPVTTITDSQHKLYRTRRRVVIVGGGFGGIVAARKLQDEFEVTLITPTRNFEYMPDHPHLILDPEYLRQICYDYKKCLTRTKIIYDKVDQVALDHVVLNRNEQTIDFDFLIVSTGRRSRRDLPIEQGSVVIDPYSQKDSCGGRRSDGNGDYCGMCFEFS
ncbi:hypothetical protein AKO1_012562 [Acrasis kona]|uniref:DEP domain-containing protein n=1 Tax=Acrasis kona TaxID=1008807 RepID=A0AAW2YY19_9EUKA